MFQKMLLVISVTCGSVPYLQIGKNFNRTRLTHSSSVNHIEALMGRKRKGYYIKANVNPVVYSSIYRAKVNPACDNDSNVKPVCTAPANVKQASRHEVCHSSSVHII